MRYIKWRRLSAVICISAMAASAIDVMALPAVEKGSYGVPEETAAFRKVAPWDFVFNDPNTYDTQQYGSIELDKVDETASVRWRSVFFNGSHMGTPYLARTGHLIASRHKTGSNPVPEAAIFYTSYTRDGLPAKDRPVTFMWNGGPGSSSIWLHLGSWAPKRLKSDAPNIANDAVWPQEFPFEANAITLLDQTDLVFVDPPGTGLSTAIAPNVNNTFWGTDSDAQVIADFITAYINKYNRQSSPKYLYGESYGGIRTPIVANLLLQSGTADYKRTPATGTSEAEKKKLADEEKEFKTITGLILNSPILDYESGCDMNWVSCKGFIPAYAMTADYHKRSTMRGASSQEDYMAELRKLARNTFEPAYEKRLYNGRAFMFTAEGKEASKKMASYTGIPEELWIDYFNLDPDAFENLLLPGIQLGRYDARMKVHSGRPGGFGADNYIDQAFKYKMTTYLSNELNYKSKSAYLPMYPGQYAEPWVYGHADRRYSPESLSDLHAILTQEPNFKLLILHGYEDLATPGFQTELDLEEANLKDRIPVKWFEGGHMIYNTEVSRVPLQKTLADFYTSPAKDASGALIVNQPADLAPIQ